MYDMYKYVCTNSTHTCGFVVLYCSYVCYVLDLGMIVA